MKHFPYRGRSSAGVTIIEILIVVAVIGILSAMAIPSLTGFLSTSKEEALKPDRSALQSAFDGYRSANANKIPIVIETGDTASTMLASLSACLGTTASALRTAPPKNNCFVDIGEIAAAGFLPGASSVESASSDNIVGGIGEYSWVVLANGEIAAFVKSTGVRVMFSEAATLTPVPTPAEETGF